MFVSAPSLVRVVPLNKHQLLFEWPATSTNAFPLTLATLDLVAAAVSITAYKLCDAEIKPRKRGAGCRLALLVGDEAGLVIQARQTSRSVSTSPWTSRDNEYISIACYSCTCFTPDCC